MRKASLFLAALFLSVYGVSEPVYGPQPAPTAAAELSRSGGGAFGEIDEALKHRVVAAYVHQGDTWYYANRGKAPRVRGRRSRTLWLTLAFDDGSHALLTFRNVKPSQIDKIYRATRLVRTEEAGQTTGDAIATVGELTAQARVEHPAQLFQLLANYTLTVTGTLARDEKVTSVFGAATDPNRRLTARRPKPVPVAETEGEG